MSRKRYTHKGYVQDKQIRKAYMKTGGVDRDGDPISFRQFKQQVKYRMKTNRLTARQAANKYLNTEVFTSAAERSRYNLTQSIKESHPEAYKEMSSINRGLRNEKGQYKSMYSNLTWSKEFNAYTLGDYIIDVSNSPKGVFITPIDKLRKQ